MNRWTRAVRAAVIGLVGATVLAACVPASPDVDTFDGKTQVTVGGAISQTRTVERLLQSLHDGRMLRTTAMTQLRSSEKSLDTNSGAFTELNPPPARSKLFDQVSTLLDQAGSLVTEARIAVSRDQSNEYPALARQLETTAKHLESVESGLQ